MKMNRELDPHVYCQLIFEKAGKIYNGLKIVSSKNGVGKTRYVHAEKWSWTTKFTFKTYYIATIIHSGRYKHLFVYLLRVSYIQNREPRRIGAKQFNGGSMIFIANGAGKSGHK